MAHRLLNKTTKDRALQRSMRLARLLIPHFTRCTAPQHTTNMAPNLDQATYVHPVTSTWSKEQQTKVWDHFLDQFATIQSRFPAPIDRFDAEEAQDAEDRHATH